MAISGQPVKAESKAKFKVSESQRLVGSDRTALAGFIETLKL